MAHRSLQICVRRFTLPTRATAPTSRALRSLVVSVGEHQDSGGKLQTLRLAWVKGQRSEGGKARTESSLDRLQGTAGGLLRSSRFGPSVLTLTA